ncbi:MAG TPA: hypothetical protein VLQ68_00520 [Rhizobiaceae bacterium]|nr:hypothetical protein [Rhizobiaceae bacterium]
MNMQRLLAILTIILLVPFSASAGETWYSVSEAKSQAEQIKQNGRIISGISCRMNGNKPEIKIAATSLNKSEWELIIGASYLEAGKKLEAKGYKQYIRHVNDYKGRIRCVIYKKP